MGKNRTVQNNQVRVDKWNRNFEPGQKVRVKDAKEETFTAGMAFLDDAGMPCVRVGGAKNVVNLKNVQPVHGGAS